jgi:hypothetical protein
MIWPLYWGGKEEKLKSSSRKSIESNKLSWSLSIRKYLHKRLEI